jgi:alkylation response protein AidB-like acyl-CoA dehydrogenase
LQDRARGSARTRAGGRAATDREFFGQGGSVSADTIVEQAFREIRAFRIYDGPTEVHKWSLAKKIKRDWKVEQY